MVAPPSLREAAHKAKSVSDWHTPTIAQNALAQFIDEGKFAHHIRKVSSTLSRTTRDLDGDYPKGFRRPPRPCAFQRGAACGRLCTKSAG
jgi:GntR family transcriptional regulator / MocR family aminotransferase